MPSPSSTRPDPPEEYRDALSHGRARGRASGLNPGNRFEPIRLHVLGEHLDEQAAACPAGSRIPTTILPDRTRTIINRVDSPDLPFHWTINPYRGCEHGCIYCYARPGHEYLAMSCGLDFETKILAKHDAPALLRRELVRWKHAGEGIVMSGVTDPYQPIERDLRITRGCLEVLRDFRQPVSIITKNHLITRDLDIFREMLALSDARRPRRDASHGAPPRPPISCAISLTTLDNRLASKMEPRASAPRERLDAIAQLARAGVPVAVMTAPIIPGLNDREIPALLKAAKEAGATGAGWVLLRLPHQIKALFTDWLAREFPQRAAHVESLLRQCRGGALYDSRPGVRQRGEGEIAKQIGRTFGVFAKRYGLGGMGRKHEPTNPTPNKERSDQINHASQSRRHQRLLFD